jgi:transcriptional regulator with XRE-family HTH domain
MTYQTDSIRCLRRMIGKNIHRLRSRQKTPLRKLSKISGVPEWLLDHYELGKNEISLDQMLKISCALHVSVTDLIKPIMGDDVCQS